MSHNGRHLRPPSSERSHRQFSPFSAMSQNTIRFSSSPSFPATAVSTMVSPTRPPSNVQKFPSESAHAWRQTPLRGSSDVRLIPQNGSGATASKRSTRTRPPSSHETRFVPWPPSHEQSHSPTQKSKSPFSSGPGH